MYLCTYSVMHAARVKLCFCSCALAHACLFMKKVLLYYIFSESACYSASFESNFSFLRQFWFFFFAIFSPKFDGVIILRFCSYAILTVTRLIPIHLKKISDFEQFSGFKCVPTTNYCFFMHNKITQDFAKFETFRKITYELITFLKISSL